MSPVDAGKSIVATQRVALAPELAEQIARDHFGIAARAERLDGEYDDNFRLHARDRSWVLKIAPVGEDSAMLELQSAALQHLGRGEPRLARVEIGGVDRHVRLLDYISGRLLADVAPQSAALLRSLGAEVARVDATLLDFDHPAAHRELQWDLLQAAQLEPDVAHLRDARRRALAAALLDRIAAEVLPVVGTLRRSVIHGDANDYNVVVSGDRVAGLIDFGDMVHSATVCDLAIAAAYAMTGKNDPLGAAAHVVAGYRAVLPLTDAERRVLFPLMLTRLAMSVVISAARKARAPDNAYYTVHEERAWRVLEQLGTMPFHMAEQVLFAARNGKEQEALRDKRAARLGENLSLSYRAPLHIVRGWKQYLYDADGREYLDAYNNVAHVGHSHPRVVEAAARQMAVLNTNTRYLHANILEYAERLRAKLPAPLRDGVCWFVNSGSEANELALRLARAHTGQRDVIVTEGAYHGNTQGLVEVSPYKFDGPGGEGRREHVQLVPIPDVYRGEFRDASAAGVEYARFVSDAVERIEELGRRPAAFLVESLPSVAGQIVPPPGYFAEAFRAVRAAGGVCIVDEVQVGFGRVGSRFWGFELQGVVPDIVVMGKPIGNGFPLGAVVTTSAIARSFANGMEYFSTFGGNPVAMAVGLAVLDVIEDEGLQENALRVGSHMLDGLRDLQTRHEVIGDVRGAGLFIGVELVLDRETLEPATAEASRVVNGLAERGILTGTEGPHHNVIKIRPPMVFDEGNADFLVATLGAVLAR